MRSVQLLPTYVEVVTASGTVLRRSRRRRRLFTNTQQQLSLDCEVALATAERKPPKEHALYFCFLLTDLLLHPFKRLTVNFCWYLVVVCVKGVAKEK